MLIPPSWLTPADVQAIFPRKTKFLKPLWRPEHNADLVVAKREAESEDK